MGLEEPVEALEESSFSVPLGMVSRLICIPTMTTVDAKSGSLHAFLTLICIIFLYQVEQVEALADSNCSAPPVMDVGWICTLVMTTVDVKNGKSILLHLRLRVKL